MGMAPTATVSAAPPPVARAAAPAPASTASLLVPGLNYDAKIDPSKISGFGTTASGMPVTAVGNAFNTDGGMQGDPTAIGYAAYDPRLARPGGEQAVYDAQGNLQQVYQIPGVSGFDKTFDAVTTTLLAYALGQVAMGAAGLSGAPGIGGADTVQGNSINALDRATGVAYGSEPSSFLTGPTNAGANYNILSSTYVPDPQSIGLEGNAGQGINLAKTSGTGLAMPTAPNLEAMGGAQGLTTAAYGGGTVSAAGTFSPYVPNLGDPSSFVNGGTSGAGASSPYSWTDMLKGAQTGLSIANTLGALGSLGGGGGQASYSGGGVGGTADASRAGAAPMGSPTGGAAGSLEGVANTLLTAKDQFGYGKTMLG